MPENKRPSDEFIALLRKSGDADINVAAAAQREFAKALELPLRKGVLVGNILGDIFETINVEAGSTTEFPLDLVSPGLEGEHVAYTNPGHGRIPERSVEGDYVMIPTYTIASSVDYLLRYAREARWDIVARAMQVMEAGFTKKMNDDGWHTLLAAGVDRNILVYDGDATAGLFSKRLVSLMQTVMRRNSGGNSASIGRGRLTDIYVSPEALEDIRNWGFDQVDETTRREIYTAPTGGAPITRIFGVNLRDLDELGEGQEYQSFFVNELGGAVQASDLELVVGLDLSTRDSFVMPVKEQLQVFEDPTLHRQQRAGYYGWAELGFGVLDNRRVILGSF
ncbi:hypothetical protein EB118_15750 [bacterium]|jgi:hypothetical protein|nr:hypothetical protein [bacterium]NDG31509.1 hypothetical protein [bacterium]